MPERGMDRLKITIEGRRVSVLCRGDVVRVVIRRPEVASLVETDFVDTVEVETWKRNMETGKS
jgi:hypothetical protein